MWLCRSVGKPIGSGATPPREWGNGNAHDFRPHGWEFDSCWPRLRPAQSCGVTSMAGRASKLLRPFLTPRFSLGLWRSDSACDSRSQGWAFESLWPHEHPAGIEPDHACGRAGQSVSLSEVEPHHRDNSGTEKHTTPDHTVGSSIPSGHASDMRNAVVSQA